MYLIILLTTVPMVGNNIIRVSGLTKRFSEKRMRKSVEFKRKVVFAVTKDKPSVASVAHEFGIARKTVYQWLKRLDGARGRAKSTALDNHYIKGNRHPRAYRFAHRHKLLRLITSDPELSITNLARRLRIGRHATVASLQELKLSTRLERENFARLYNGPGRLHLDIKGQIVRAVLDEGKSIAEVAREFKVARKTIHVWIKRYQADKRLSEKYVVGLAHPKALSPDMRNKILAAVIKNPQASIHKLARNLSISSHGVWNILKIHNLTHAPARLAFAQKEMQDFTLPNLLKTDRVRSVWETFTPNLAPAPPPSSIEQFSSTSPQNLPPISTLNLLKLIIKASISTFISLLKLPSQLPRWWMSFLAAFIIPVIISGVLLSGVNYLSLILQAPTVTVGIGYLFASLALSFGLFFFLYSSKYYLSALLVLRFSRKIITQDETNAATKSLTSNHQQSGLVSDVSQIELTRLPFVSIHLPLYNEKRVVNRLLEAVTSLDYPNYEVIVCDDSTDETKDIVLEWQNHPRVKISHRENRQGYKGGALKQALSLMDPKTEFVLVFDADFLPYPDTITQFLKYFQVTSKAGHPRPRIEYGAGSDRGSPSESIPIEIDSRLPPEADRRGNDNFNYADSNIAAIQGYQWHVLNKSENWVTRGVRSEYAGSYVIERSGNEIYGGLKQIAGSVFMIRADLLKLPEYQWGTSITEDFELTLKLYRDGYKVVYTPYIQAPSECVSTLKRLIRQRMRWAEGHSHNIRKHFTEMLFGSSHLTSTEKLEFLYLAPYYLQSCFFVLGTLFWFTSEVVFKTALPFWTQVWGWSLVLTNLLSLPLMNTVGMFLEEAEEKDYAGIPAFLLLSYILAPFQAYAAIKGFLEVEEGPWFRTPKTGKITDTFKRGRFYLWVSRILDRPKPAHTQAKVGLRLPELVRPPKLAQAGNAVLAILLTLTIILTSLAGFIPQTPTARASETHLKTLASVINNQQSQTKTREKIENPLISQFPISPGSTLEYIFHPEPRFRVKLDQYEVEATIIASPDLGEPKRVEAYKQNNKYVYPEIFPGVDLKYSDNKLFIQEEFILKEPTKLTQFAEKVKLTNLTISQAEGRVHLVTSEGGSPVFTFEKPYLYEEKHPEVKNEGIRYEIEKGAFDYTVKKVLTEEGKIWLADPNRSYPVVVDPTLYQSSPVATGIAQNEVRTGSAQRKIVYSTNSSAWYVFTSNDAKISYNKCSASSNCDEDSDWGTAVTVSTDTGRQHGVNLWYQQAGTDAGKIFAAWMDDSTVTEATDDSLAFRTIDTANSDNLGTQCNSPDAGDLTFSSYVAYIAAGNNGDVLVGYSRLNGAETPSDIFEVPTGGG